MVVAHLNLLFTHFLGWTKTNTRTIIESVHYSICILTAPSHGIKQLSVFPIPRIFRNVCYLQDDNCDVDDVTFIILRCSD